MARCRFHRRRRKAAVHTNSSGGRGRGRRRRRGLVVGGSKRACRATGDTIVASVSDRLEWCSFSPARWRSIGRVLGLCPREFQIVRGVFDGKGDARMARELGISRSTVRTYVTRLHQKLGVHDRHELLLCVFGAYQRLEDREEGDKSIPPHEHVEFQRGTV